MWILLSFVMILGGFFRTWGIAQVPPELFGDEIDVGYQAYSLLKTGRDLYSQPMPTLIHSLSEWRAPLQIYFTVPTIGLFGLNEWGVRLPSAILGTLGIVIIYLLVRQTIPVPKIKIGSWNLDIGVVVCFMLATMPWHIHYSRTAFETVLLLDLVLMGTLLFLRNRFVLSAIFFALTLYTYSTATFFTPIWLGVLLVSKSKKPSKIATITLFVLILPFIFNLFFGSASSRFGLLSIFNNQDIIKNILVLRTEETKNAALWHNKYEAYFSVLLGNYLRTFSTEFLFVRGDPVYRHSIQVVGQLLPITFPFFFLGLYYLATRKQWLWLTWLLLAPLPSILTSDGGYHATRLALMVPPLAIILGAGFFYGVSLLSQRFRWIVVCLYLIPFTLYFIWVAHYYTAIYSKQSWQWWNYGYKQIMQQIPAISKNFSRVFINNTYEPSLERFLFWTGYSPAKFHKEFTLDQSINNIVPNYSGFSLDGKYFFGDFSKKEWTATLLPNSLYLISQRDNVAGDWDWRTSAPSNVTVLATSVDPYNRPLFYLITKK